MTFRSFWEDFTRKLIFKFTLPQIAKPNSSIESPDSLDWRKRRAVTEVKDQTVECGSCWAFSSIGALESHNFIKTGQLLNLSEQQLVDCSSHNRGCEGGSTTIAFNYIIENGISLGKDYPYTAKDGECHMEDDLKSNVTVYGYAYVMGDEEELKRAVNEFGPIQVVINASPMTFHFYSEGIFHDPACDDDDTNHAVLIVGYGTDNKTKTDFWIVKNSWSKQWGENGYVRMARNVNSTCGILANPVYPLLDDNGRNYATYPLLIILGTLLAVITTMCCCCCCLVYCWKKCCRRNEFNLC